MELTAKEIKELEELKVKLTEVAYIVKVGSEWCVKGEGGRPMGCYPSRKQAEERLAQVEMFKHIKSGNSDFNMSSVSQCFCGSCDAEFISNKPCYLSRCPICHEQDDIVELTGIIE